MRGVGGREVYRAFVAGGRSERVAGAGWGGVSVAEEAWGVVVRGGRSRGRGSGAGRGRVGEAGG